MKLLQDTGDPWSHFVACIMLNRCRASVVEPVFRGFLLRYPDERHVTVFRPDDLGRLREFLRPLGLAGHRATAIYAMSREYTVWKINAERGVPLLASRLPGIGRYGEDSYRVLFLNERPKVTDKKLKLYLKEKYGDEAAQTHSA